MLSTSFTPVHAAIGGCLIGAASSLSQALNGKVPGISGVLARMLRGVQGDTWWRVCFVVGLLCGGAAYRCWSPGWLGEPLAYQPAAAPMLTVIAGLLVGFGARLGGGCTSGHGICGIGAGSKASIAATAMFMATAILTVLISRQFFWLF